MRYTKLVTDHQSMQYGVGKGSCNKTAL